MTEVDLVRPFDRTSLQPEAAPEAVCQLCAEDRQFGFASAWVNPAYVLLAFSLPAVAG